MGGSRHRPQNAPLFARRPIPFVQYSQCKAQGKTDDQEERYKNGRERTPMGSVGCPRRPGGLPPPCDT